MSLLDYLAAWRIVATWPVQFRRLTLRAHARSPNRVTHFVRIPNYWHAAPGRPAQNFSNSFHSLLVPRIREKGKKKWRGEKRHDWKENKKDEKSNSVEQYEIQFETVVPIVKTVHVHVHLAFYSVTLFHFDSTSPPQVWTRWIERKKHTGFCTPC